MSKHTQGQWFADGCTVNTKLDSGFIAEICKTGSADHPNADQQMANAKLIAAAPELYAALSDARIALSLAAAQLGEPFQTEAEKARAALSKFK